MLLMDSMARLALAEAWEPRAGSHHCMVLPRPPLARAPPARVPGRQWSAISVGRGDVLLHDLAVGLEPLGRLLELTAFDGPDLHPAAALVVLRGDVEGRNEPAESEVFDLLHPVLDVLTAWLAAALGLDGVADRFEVDGCEKHAAVVDDGVGLLLGRLLALRLVHGIDFSDRRIIVADTCELHAAVAFRGRKPACGVNVGLSGTPHQRDHLAQGITLALELLDRHRR